MRRARRFVSPIVLGLLLSAAAFAQTAYTVREANVRAGPERDYPVVTRLAAGTPVSVSGCNEDWTWCEVIAEPDRGWVYAGSNALVTAALGLRYTPHEVSLIRTILRNRGFTVTA